MCILAVNRLSDYLLRLKNIRNFSQISKSTKIRNNVLQYIMDIVISLGAYDLRPNYHYNHYITISNKFCMANM